MTDGTFYGNRLVAVAKLKSVGLLTYASESPAGLPADSCEFVYLTGTTALPDVPATAGTSTIIPDTDVPTGMKCYVTSIQVYVGATLWGGGTGATVSLTLQDSAGTAIATFTQNALAATTYISLPAAGTLPTGVVDSLLKTLGASTAAGKGIQALVANSSTGTAVKIRVRGFFAP